MIEITIPAWMAYTIAAWVLAWNCVNIYFTIRKLQLLLRKKEREVKPLSAYELRGSGFGSGEDGLWISTKTMRNTKARKNAD